MHRCFPMIRRISRLQPRPHPNPGFSRSRCDMICPTAISAASPACFHCRRNRSEEHTSELQSLMRISYAVFCLKKKKKKTKRRYVATKHKPPQIQIYMIIDYKTDSHTLHI